MNGMKDGVGDDPFDRDDLVDEDGADGEGEDVETATATAGDTETKTTDSTASKADLPYIYRRDRVTDEREQLPIYLREETLATLDEQHRAFEDLIGEDVSTIDFRELALLVGAQQLDDLAERAREWGYGMD